MSEQEIKKTIMNHFGSGFHCSEAIAKAILESYSKFDQVDVVVRAASGFGGGIAGTQEELCGAFTGGVMALSALLGRSVGGQELRQCAKSIKAFKQEFLESFGSLNCGQILEGLGTDPLECVRLTAKAGQMVVGILQQTEKDHGLTFMSGAEIPRDKVALGTCPFSSTSCTCQ